MLTVRNTANHEEHQSRDAVLDHMRRVRAGVLSPERIPAQWKTPAQRAQKAAMAASMTVAQQIEWLLLPA